MEAHNPIDDMFQQHFAEATIPMNNQEELWTRISKKKDNRKGGFFWFGGLGLVLCVITGFWVINLNNSTSQNVVSIELVNTSIINTNPNNIEKSQIILAESETDKEEVIELEKTNIVSGNRDIENAKTAGVLLKNAVSLNGVKPKGEELSDFFKGKIGNNDDLVEIGNSLIETSSFNKARLPISVEHKQDLGIQELKGNSRITINVELADIDGLDLKLFNNIPPLFDQSDSWSRCEVKTPGHFFIDAYGQVGLPMDKVDLSQEGSDQAAYRDLWGARFDPVASWHGGAQIGYELRSGLRVSAGVEYQELITEYSDNQQITETVRVWDPQAFFTIDMNGDQVWVGDTVTAINIYENKFVRKNTYRMLHIPVQFSYDVYKRPGMHVALDVAAALNVSKSYQGQYIRSDQTLIMIDKDAQDNYTSKDIGVSFALGLHVGKYLNDNWELYVSPRFRYNPNSYLLDTETLKVTRNVIGLRGGVRYHF